MAIDTGSQATLDLRLPSAVKEAVEQAAAHLGQSVDEFAVSALAHTAREVIEQRGVTVLTARDWDRLVALLDEPAEPNAALKAAAERYKQQFEYAPESRWVIARLGPGHDRGSFDCGNAALDDWLKQRAGQFDRKDLARTYVAVRIGEPKVLGYYAISTHGVRREDLPDDQAKGLPRIDIPVILLGRLAVDRSAQGRRMGSLLVIDALRRIELLADQVGIRAVEVHAIDDAARNFYLKFGFVRLLDDPNHLFLAMPTLRQLGLAPRGAGPQP